MARWIRPDPAGTADGLDLYCMVRNNPATYYDRAWPLPAYVEMAERVGANRVYQIPPRSGRRCLRSRHGLIRTTSR